MAHKALPKLEIDVTRIEQLADAADIAKRHSCAALIVAADLVTTASMTRSAKQAKFKIITTVDLPRGELYGKEKFRGLPAEAMGVEGFEILLTARQNAHEVLQEVKYLSEFCRNYFGMIPEIRFVLDINQVGRNPIFVQNVLAACKTIPMPAVVRTTHLTKITPTQSSIENSTKIIAEMKSICNVPVKISGNVDFTIYERVPADRFGVSVAQAQAISKEVAGKLLRKPVILGSKSEDLLGSKPEVTL